MQSIGFLKKVQDKGLKVWQTRSHASILYHSVPADCIERVVSTKSEEIMHQKTSTPRPTSNAMITFSVVLVLGNQSWMRRSSQSTSEIKEYHKKHSVKMKIERKESEDWRKQSKEKGLIRDLRKTDTFNPFSEESKKIIHNLGNVEYLELCQVSGKTQGSSCAKYCPDGVVHCTCGDCLIPSEKTRLMTKEKFDLLSIPSFITKKRHLAVHDTATT